VLARNLLGLGGLRAGGHRGAPAQRLMEAGRASHAAGRAMTINNLTARTQNWSWVPFGLYFLILGAYTAGQAPRRVLLALPRYDLLGQCHARSSWGWG